MCVKEHLSIAASVRIELLLHDPKSVIESSGLLCQLMELKFFCKRFDVIF